MDSDVDVELLVEGFDSVELDEDSPDVDFPFFSVLDPFPALLPLLA
ncbi:MAG TPA: hypothetical protein VE621_05895 [Bryobacteraceae bacterium]|nr:hypothetical protein [Bryobacteraceae bacterium]